MEQGATKKFYNKVNTIMCIQWNDNKVVTTMSTAWCESEVDILRQVGSDVKTYKTEKAVKEEYQDIMGSVDCDNQKWTMAGGWKSSIKFKK